MKKAEKNIHISDLLYRYLHGELVGDEEKILEVWCQHPRNMEFFLEIKNTGMLYGGMLDMQYIDTERQFQRINSIVKKKKRVRLVKYFIGVVAVLLFGILVIPELKVEEPARIRPVPLAQEVKLDASATLVTSTGEVVYLKDSVRLLALQSESEKQVMNMCDVEPVASIRQGVACNVLTASKSGNMEITLYDGTRVWLNAGSKLKYPNAFTDHQRTVYLKGEAFFEVTKDSLRPFVVKTDFAQIDVLGTRFNVATSENACVTTLVEGCVKMKNNRQDSVVIYPGKQVSASADGKLNVISVDTRYSTGWMYNLFAFEDVPLREIMRALSEWYGFTYSFEEFGLGDVRFTTMVKRYADLDRVLRILEGTEDFRCERINNSMIIKRK